MDFAAAFVSIANWLGIVGIYRVWHHIVPNNYPPVAIAGKRHLKQLVPSFVVKRVQGISVHLSVIYLSLWLGRRDCRRPSLVPLIWVWFSLAPFWELKRNFSLLVMGGRDGLPIFISSKICGCGLLCINVQHEPRRLHWPSKERGSSFVGKTVGWGIDTGGVWFRVSSSWCIIRWLRWLRWLRW